MIQFVIFMGKPGSGKGTQAQYFSKHGWIHLSTGDLFRRHLAEKTPLGKQVQEFVENGNLVPDELTFALVEDFLKSVDQNANIVFDGYPRSKRQAELLDSWSKKTGSKCLGAIEFCLSDESAMERLLNRYYCPVCGYVSNKPGFCVNDGTPLVKRIDDNVEVIQKRVRDYDSYGAELRAYYRNKGIYVAVDAGKEPEEISAFLERIMLKNGLR
ncbi:adenylate kinase family protein [Coprothermobacter platensis]|uniref:adenylate kinase family protein n=1 Tax=Coprothermobacter platensis TaxID=108819 RepID=UPI000366E11C|nr:nucleoside monophosphate kinase [Coprothermobacter platensis]